ncbi:MAG TPA: formate dehydrogenase accessory sulfurtransferase FdhD [Chloroflexia bacterium]|nr:formate dehydrogenase accessory sulfurtransferase FdhD [Chloroflexia bacterium]
MEREQVILYTSGEPEWSGTGHPPASMSATEPVLRYSGDTHQWTYDNLAVEEPLQIRLAGEDVAVAMRTPGHDIELGVGFLYTEGIIAGKHHIEAVRHCAGDDGSLAQNIVNLLPTDHTLLDPRKWRRNFYSTSSCGICGKTTISQVTAQAATILSEATVSLQTLYELVPRLQSAQAVFTQTGGLHAAGLFDTGGNLLVMREDVGRHNAVDKVIGYALLNNLLPLGNHILLVSSRASFEIVQKAAMSGISIMAVISAPSSLAVELAREAGMTLIAFLREGRLNVYSGQDRIVDKQL